MKNFIDVLFNYICIMLKKLKLAVFGLVLRMLLKEVANVEWGDNGDVSIDKSFKDDPKSFIHPIFAKGAGKYKLYFSDNVKEVELVATVALDDLRVQGYYRGVIQNPSTDNSTIVNA
jgi:hypothetical protein